MKRAKSRKHRSDYYDWRDPWAAIFDITIVAVAVALLLGVLLVIIALSTPRLATAGDAVNFRTSRRLAAPKPAVTILCEISAYSPQVCETDGDPFTTASGKRVYVGGIAADPRVLPLGSRVIIPNYNNGEACTVVDTGSYIKGNRLDVFLWKTEDAIHWGRRRGVKVQVLFVPKEGL